MNVGIRSAQSYARDSRNDEVLVYVNGDMIPRGKATVSVFDSGFSLGDGIWEGIRLVRGKLLAIEEHMDRLYEGAATIQLDIGLSKQDLIGKIKKTLDANKMYDGVHIRLMITRGVKITPNQDPRFVISSPTIVITAEYKAPNPQLVSKGLTLLTSTIRCSSADVFDLRLNSHSRLNFIHALLQAINVGCDEALMLDQRGFVASCNSTNFFIFRKGELWTSTGAYNFKGITRQKVIDLCRQNICAVREIDFTLAEVYTADEAFVTGTLGGVTPVSTVDGRKIGLGTTGVMTMRISALYRDYIENF